MLHLIDDALEALVRQRLANTGVDVSFHAPDGDWMGGISRPTVNLFLWDVRPSDDGGSGVVTVRDADGRTTRRPARPRIELRYLVTAWSTAERDEHQLLGTLIALFAQGQVLDREVLPQQLRDLEPLPTLALATREPGDRADFWNALGGRYHAGLDLLVRATVDPEIAFDTGPPVEVVEVGVADRREPARSSRRRRVSGTVADPAAVGATVRTPHGRGRVGPGGHFLVPGEPGDVLVVETVPERRTTVPADGAVALD